MFTAIIDTPVKTKFATFFLASTPRSFHPEELRRSLGETGSTVQTILRQFSRQGFLRTFDRRGESYYRLNTRYPYIEELRSFLLKKSPPRIKDNVCAELSKLNNTLMVILTGLLTGETQMPTDLVIVGTPTAHNLKRIIDNVEKELRQELNYTLFTQREFEDRLNMNERFIRDLFENAHIILFDKRPKSSKTKIFSTTGTGIKKLN